jgi:hypothetical protein
MLGKALAALIVALAIWLAWRSGRTFSLNPRSAGVFLLLSGIAGLVAVAL